MRSRSNSSMPLFYFRIRAGEFSGASDTPSSSPTVTRLGWKRPRSAAISSAAFHVISSRMPNGKRSFWTSPKSPCLESASWRRRSTSTHSSDVSGLCDEALCERGRLRPPGVPARYHENGAYIPRRLKVQRFSALLGLARLLLHMRESGTRFPLSSSRCASLREALPRHRQGLPSSVRLARAEIPLQLLPLPFPFLTRHRPSLLVMR
jgi:hypothetical protein